LQTPDQQKRSIVCTLKEVAPGHELPLHHHGRPQVGKVTHYFTEKSRRSDSDNSERIIVQSHLAANNGGVAGEPLLPISIADDRDRIASRGTALVGCKRASQERFDAKRMEIILASESAANCFWLRFHGGLNISKDCALQHVGTNVVVRTH